MIMSAPMRLFFFHFWMHVQFWSLCHYCRSEQHEGSTSAASAASATSDGVVNVELMNSANNELRKALKRKYEAKKKKRTAAGTKKNYLRFQRIFCEQFMKKYFPEVPLAHTVDSFLENPVCAEHLQNKEMMENQNIVLLFLESLPEFCVKNLEDLGTSTFGSARSAIRDLFKRAKMLWKDDSAFGEEISDWCKGNNRTIAEFRLSGRTKANIGKRHMFFDLYIALAKEYFNAGLLFEWAYHVLTWNLMTRGVSTSALRWSHIQAANDNCVFIIPKSKADQEGVKLDPKHVFVNTVNPYICPIFALAMYTLCLRTQDPLEIFPGGNQLSRFAKALGRKKSQSRLITQLLTAHGYDPSDIGVHSIRKGAGSYAANGIVAMCPSISSICLRAGWTQGAIKDKYLKYEHAQDTYLGRVLCGFPVCGAEVVRFGELPPTWGKNITRAEVTEALKIAFPCTQDAKFPVSAMGLFNRMLAVLVKNHWWVENVACEHIDDHDHPYFSTRFYLDNLPTKLFDLLDNDPTLMTPSGVPEYITSIVEVRELKKLVHNFIEVQLPNTREQILSGVSELLDEKGVRSGNFTAVQCQRMLDERFDRLERRLSANGALQSQREVVHARTGGGDEGSADMRRKGLTAWNEWRHADRGNAWYAIPPNCKYPNPTCGVLALIAQYYNGRVVDGTNGNAQIMPVRLMDGACVPANTKRDDTVTPPTSTTRARSRLSEAKQFVKFLEQNIKLHWPDEAERGYRFPPTRAKFGKMFEHATTILNECVPSSDVHPSKRRKTCNQKGWITHLRDVRKWKREQGIGGKLESVVVTF